MSEVVLDSSAVLALLFNEPGADAVAARLPDAVMSSVNLAEVLAKLADRGASDEDLHVSIDALGLTIIGHDEAQAFASARLRRSTRDAGLSLGDRACLALAEARGVPAMTADRAWSRVASVDLVQIR